MILEAAFVETTLNSATIRGRFACFSSEQRLYACKKCSLHFDLVVFITKAGDYSGLTVGSRFLQGDKHVEIVAFSHEREISIMTVSGDDFGPIIPLRVVIEAAEEAELVEYATFKARQAQLLKQYEDGENELERQEHVKKLENDLRLASAELKSAKADIVLGRSREKSLKEKLEDASAADEELEKERSKTKKLKREMKELADSAKLADEMTEDNSRLRRENESLRREVDSLRSDVERANKRQRTSESGDYRNAAPQSNGLNLDHLKESRIKSINIEW